MSHAPISPEAFRSFRAKDEYTPSSSARLDFQRFDLAILPARPHNRRRASTAAFYIEMWMTDLTLGFAGCKSTVGIRRWLQREMAFVQKWFPQQRKRHEDNV
jgi:hypothetical protein